MRLKNNQIAILAILFIMVSVIGNIIVYKNASILITGKSIAIGYVKICINHAPELSIGCNNEAIIGSQYSCDVDANDYDNTVTAGSQNLSFGDNTSLFDINPSSGLIQFTPSAAQNGIYSINITVHDNSSCVNSADSDAFSLAIVGPYCGDGICNNAETCSSCSQDCGTCAEKPLPSGLGKGKTVLPPSKINLNAEADSFAEGYRVRQAQGNKVTFTINGKEYTIEIKKLRADSIDIKIAEELAVLRIGDSDSFDVDKDGTWDILITLSSIEMGRAEMVYKLLLKPRVSPPIEEERRIEEETELPAPEEEPRERILMGLLIILVLVTFYTSTLVLISLKARKGK